MRIIIFTVILGLCLVGPGLGAPPKTATDGSLVLDSAGESARSKASAGDTLHELLGQEVQVFIFNSKTRVWPGRTWHPLPMKTGLRRWSTCVANPQLESLIQKYAGAYGVDPSLVRAVIRHESGGNAGAVSPKGAQGLMQLMPGTADLMGVRNPFDPEQNIAGGVGYLRRCLDRFQHNVPLAVAAYNAGPESVARYGTVPPYAETQLFVNSVLGTYTGQTPPAKAAVAPVKAPPAGARGARKAAKPAADPDQAATEAPRPPKRPKIIEVRPSKARATGVSAKMIKGTEVNSTVAPRLE